MHISDGVLSAPVLAAGWATCSVGVIASTWKLDDDDLPQVAVMTSVFFVASFLHVPWGVQSFHLSLPALMGIVLGKRVFVATAVAVLFQALLTAHGGFTTIGVTTTILAAPAWVAGLIFQRYLAGRTVVTQSLGAAVLSVGAILVAVLLQGLALVASGEEFFALATWQVLILLPLTVVEALVTAPVVLFLGQVKPALLGSRPESTDVRDADASGD
ncbi:MAG: CbiM family transporter [Planctomycetota bacterium]